MASCCGPDAGHLDGELSRASWQMIFSQSRTLDTVRFHVGKHCMVDFHSIFMVHYECDVLLLVARPTLIGNRMNLTALNARAIYTVQYNRSCSYASTEIRAGHNTK